VSHTLGTRVSRSMMLVEPLSKPSPELPVRGPRRRERQEGADKGSVPSGLPEVPRAPRADEALPSIAAPLHFFRLAQRMGAVSLGLGE
jgi:hypothetical protein